MDIEHSRALKLAADVSRKRQRDLESHLDSTWVVISVDPDYPLADLTTRILITTLRRGLGNFALVARGLPSAFVTELEELAQAIDPLRPLKVVRHSGGMPSTAVTVHVGPTAPSRAIRIVPEGYGAHVAGHSAAVIRPRQRPTPLGAAYTAALGAAEVFKYTAEVIPPRRVLHRHLQFCPVSLSANLSSVHQLAGHLTLDVTLVGVGAIGTAVVLLLDLLDAEGRLVAVDNQHYAAENRGTYSLGGQREADLKPWKVDIARDVLSTKFDVVPRRESVAEFVSAIDRREVRGTSTVVTALDSPDARRDAQRLWPDHLLDTGTGDTMLGLHDLWYGTDPCLWCIFPQDTGRPSGAQLVAERLGISPEVLGKGEVILTTDHLIGLTEEQQQMLRPHVGTPMCGLAEATGLTRLNADEYRPSVPFVSLQAACLAVGRLIANHCAHVPASNLIQYDGLFGPQAATLERLRPLADCICAVRARTLQEVRKVRYGT